MVAIGDGENAKDPTIADTNTRVKSFIVMIRFCAIANREKKNSMRTVKKKKVGMTVSHKATGVMQCSDVG